MCSATRIRSVRCEFCTYNFELSLDCCPHCGRPSLFPNVAEADQEEEHNALQQRYQEAQADASRRGARVVLIAFEQAVAAHSRAVAARHVEEAGRLASSDNKIYPSFYEEVEAGIRTPNGGPWDRDREPIDSMLFNYYKKAIRFAALSLDERGVEDYGECFMLLREDMIAHRATVFEANSVKFVKAKVIAMGSMQIPPGYRAVWQERGYLAVAKLARHLAANTPADAFPRLLLTGRDTGLDDFIEVHIYGPMTIRSWLNMDSSQLCQKHAEERSEQPFAPDAGVVHKLEEPEIPGQLLLRDAAMGAQPGA